MFQVRTELTVDRLSEEVFAFISNFENNRKWQSHMREAKFTWEGPPAPGRPAHADDPPRGQPQPAGDHEDVEQRHIRSIRQRRHRALQKQVDIAGVDPFDASRGHGRERGQRRGTKYPCSRCHPTHVRPTRRFRTG